MNLEIKRQPNRTGKARAAGATMLITPPISEDYWTYRVEVSPNQAIVGFPKFNTIGIGFQHEDDWNTNLPYTSSPDEIIAHIWPNRGPGNGGADFMKRCLDAIRLIQEAVKKEKQNGRLR